jgi:hypothetical protein
MDIIIGSVPPIGPNPPKPKETGLAIEADLLHVRPPRKGIAGPSGVERRGKRVQDPQKGRILTLLIPDATLLPKDIDQGRYKVVLRFIRK